MKTSNGLGIIAISDIAVSQKTSGSMFLLIPKFLTNGLDIPKFPRDRSFSTYVKFSEKLAFVTPDTYTH